MLRILASLFILMFSVVFCPLKSFALDDKMHTYYLSPEWASYQFKDRKIKESGALYGLNGGYRYTGTLPKLSENWDRFMINMDARILPGRIDLKGRLYDGQSYKITNVKQLLMEFRALVGYDFDIVGLTVTPYTGLGYRYFQDFLAKSDAGYRRQSNYWYLPIGFDLKKSLVPGWAAGLTLEYDHLFFGEQNTFLSDLDSGFSDFTNDLDKGYAFRGDVRVQKKFEDKNINFGPYFVYWHMDQSKSTFVKHSGIILAETTEPSNHSAEMGLKVSVEY